MLGGGAGTEVWLLKELASVYSCRIVAGGREQKCKIESFPHPVHNLIFYVTWESCFTRPQHVLPLIPTLHTVVRDRFLILNF